MMGTVPLDYYRANGLLTMGDRSDIMSGFVENMRRNCTSQTIDALDLQLSQAQLSRPNTWGRILLTDLLEITAD